MYAEKTKTKQFQDLIVWQKAHEFVLMIYRFVKSFPNDERYGLISQFKRAAVSIPSNIAEGYKKYGKKDKVRFFNISQGSLEECRYYLILAKDLNYGSDSSIQAKLEEVSKLLNSYVLKVQESYEK